MMALKENYDLSSYKLMGCDVQRAEEAGAS